MPSPLRWRWSKLAEWLRATPLSFMADRDGGLSIMAANFARGQQVQWCDEWRAFNTSPQHDREELSSSSVPDSSSECSRYCSHELPNFLVAFALSLIPFASSNAASDSDSVEISPQVSHTFQSEGLYSVSETERVISAGGEGDYQNLEFQNKGFGEKSQCFRSTF